MNSSNDNIFDKRQTNIAKGVALLLLFWHHLFFDAPENYHLFTSVWNNTVPIECFFARFCRVCVAMFLFLSGFGLYKSWQKDCEIIIRFGDNNLTIRHYLVFLKNHILKLMFNYWFVFLIFVPMGILFGREFWIIYEGNIFYGIFDFCGLADMFSTPTMNATWWFMSTIILLYVLFPLFAKVLEWSPETFVVLSIILMVFPYFSSIVFIGQYFVWFPPFVVGMYFAHQDSFDKIRQNNEALPKQIVFSVLLILLSAFISLVTGNSVSFDTLFAFSIILFSYFVLSKIPIVCGVLEQLGKHSGAIFMFHTFIFLYYFKELIYWFKYSLIIFIVMTVVCYIISVGLEKLKKLLGYDKLVEKLKSSEQLRSKC